MAEILYGRAAIEAEQTYNAFADVNYEYVLSKAGEKEGRTFTQEEFEEWYEEITGECPDDLDSEYQAALIERYGEAAVQLEILSDTPEEDEEQVLAWLRKLLVKEKFCGVSDWDDSPLSWNRTGLALGRLVKQGRLVKRDGAYLVPHDFELSLSGVLCDGCDEDFGWTHIPTKLHRECARALISALSAALGEESPAS